MTVTRHAPLLGSIWLSAFLVSIDYTALNVALPTLSADFGVGTSDVSWIALAYMLVIVALTLVTGPVIERFGYTRALGVALVLFAASSLASTLAPSFWLLVALRAAQGIGASVMFVIGPAVIKTHLPPEAHDRAFALFSTGPTAGLCAGPAIGGELTTLFGWPSVFWFNVATALLALLLLAVSARRASTEDPTTRRAGRMPSSTTAAIAVAGMLMLVLAFNQGKEWGWSSAAIVLPLVAGGTALAAVIMMERRSTSPLIDRHIFQSRDFSAAAAAFLLLLLVFGGSVFLLPFYFEWLRALGTDTVGHVLMVQPLATIVVSNLAAFWLGGTTRRTLCLAGLPVLVVGVALLAVSDRHAPLLLPCLALLLMGAGIGLYYPALIQVAMARIPTALAASASSLQAAIRVLAQLLGVVIFETVFSQLYPAALDVARAAAATGADLDRMQSAFHAVFWCGTIIAALALVPAMLLTGDPGPTGSPGETADTEGV